MALKAETPLTDYSEVSSAISRFKEKEKLAADSRILHHPSAKQDGALVNPVGKGKRPVSESAGREEFGNSWKQEYLVAENPDDGRLVCMVCGGLLARSGPAAARQHILQHHAHSLDFTLEEKHNILEGWSEGAVLPEKESPPSSAAESLHLDAERRLPVRQRPPAKDPRGQEPIEAAGKEWLSECGLPGSAPAEIRIFTDGSFPAGFTLKLYCRSQPGGWKKVLKILFLLKLWKYWHGSTLGTDHKAFIYSCCARPRDAAGRLHPSPDTLAPPCPLGSSADRCPKDCGVVRGAGRRAAPAGKEASTPLGKGFNPTWRARFLVDFDAATGHLVCMVCEYPLRRICLATVKQHILQCHAETLQMPREVRRTILEVWENRSQPSTQVQRK
ncbi:hypothetical protein Chor_014749 [Crotalus horridus]